MASNAVLIVVSGVAADRVPSLGDRTPLEAARMPCLDRLTREGVCGLLHVAGKGRVPKPGTVGALFLGVDAAPATGQCTVPGFAETFGVTGAFISGGPAMEVPCLPGLDVPAGYDTDFDKKLAAATVAMENNEFLLFHVNETARLHAAGDHEGMVALCERIDDLVVAPFLAMDPGIVVAVTTDYHRDAGGTVTAAPVPVAIHGEGVRPDDVATFTEHECENGGLVEIDGRDLIYIMLDLIGKVTKFGLDDD